VINKVKRSLKKNPAERRRLPPPVLRRVERNGPRRSTTDAAYLLRREERNGALQIHRARFGHPPAVEPPSPMPSDFDDATLWICTAVSSSPPRAAKDDTRSGLQFLRKLRPREPPAPICSVSLRVPRRPFPDSRANALCHGAAAALTPEF
jgi:hypothetical protein